MSVPLVHGQAAAGFGKVADAFAASLPDPDASGAALAIYLDGEPVVGLWAGHAGAPEGAPWTANTLSVVFSCTKGLLAILAAQLVADGRLAYDDPVARWWPAFAACAKHEISVRQLLGHRAGLSALRVPLATEDILEWDTVAGLLASQAPLWPPGTGHAYHTITFGWLVGEVLRRATGMSVGALFEERIAGPLGVDAFIGLPPEHHGRVAPMRTGPTMTTEPPVPPVTGEDWVIEAATLGGALPPGLVGPGTGFNDPRLWSAEIPGAGGIASADALARIWSATVCETGGVRLLDDAILARATRVESEGAPVFDVPPPWSRWGMGFQLDSEARRYLTPAGFGHDGAGGQVAFAEPGLRLGFAYLTNLMEGAGDRRATAIVDALRQALGR